MLLRLGRFVIDCPYLGVWSCEARKCVENHLLEWKPEDCRDCSQCRSFQELPEARIKKEVKDELET